MQTLSMGTQARHVPLVPSPNWAAQRLHGEPDLTRAVHSGAPVISLIVWPVHAIPQVAAVVVVVGDGVMSHLAGLVSP